MKIFLMSFNNQAQIEAARILKKKGVDILYWTGARRVFDAARNEKDLFSGTIFHDTYEAARGEPAPGISISDFEIPIEVMKDMYDQESVVLTMMNAIDFTNMPLNKKKNIYYAYVTYWYGVLRKYSPDAVLFADIPHMAHNYVVFCLAKRLGIKTIMYTDARRVPNRLIFFEDFRDYKELKEAYAPIKDKTTTLTDLDPDIREFYKNQTDSSKDSTPPMTRESFFEERRKDTQLIPKPSAIIRNIKKGTLRLVARRYLDNLTQLKRMASLEKLEMTGLQQRRLFRRWEALRKDFIKEYKNLEVHPDFLKPYVYVPLHVQPERSTSAEGGIYHDQILMIAMLARTIPSGWVVYVKEHIPQWLAIRAHLGRYKGYYQRIAQLPNVFLVPAETSTFALIEKSKAVATVTGSAAWEGLFRGKPALIFGDVFFSLCDGAYKVTTEGDLHHAFLEIQKGRVPSQQKLINFLFAIQSISIPGHDKHKFNKTKHIDDATNAQYIANGFYQKLRIS